MNPRDLIQERYRLEAALGTGGMAEVWCALDERLDRKVAIKFLDARFADDPEFLVRFFTEAQSVARISHPNVVPVLDFGETEGRPYLVMEYVSGGSLADLTGEPVQPERAVHLLTQAARGAGAAHALGLVHRDIKPPNILLTERDHAMLADFGISTSGVHEKLTATGTAIGSPHYVSPEHASGAETTAASDVYSLGVVLYELLAGRRPFEADNATALAIAHVEEEPEPPSVHVPDLDPDIDAIVMACLAKDPAARFPNGSELAEALEGRAVIPVPAAVSPAETTGELYAEPPIERNSKRALVGGLLVVAFLVALAFGVMALARRTEPVARADNGKATTSEPRRTATPSSPEGDVDGVVAVPEPTSSPAPSPTESEEPEEAAADARSEGGGDDTQSEPEPEPTTEPTTEPTSEPTTQPTSEAGPEPTPAP